MLLKHLQYCDLTCSVCAPLQHASCIVHACASRTRRCLQGSWYEERGVAITLQFPLHQRIRVQQTITGLAKHHQAAWDTAVAMVEAGAAASTEEALAAELVRLLERLRGWRPDGREGQLGLRHAGDGTIITAGSGGSGSAAVPMAAGFPPPGQDWVPRLADGTVGRSVYLALQVEKLLGLQYSNWTHPPRPSEAAGQATSEYLQRCAGEETCAVLPALPASAQGVSMARCSNICQRCPVGFQESSLRAHVHDAASYAFTSLSPPEEEERAYFLVSFDAAPPTLGVGVTLRTCPDVLTFSFCGQQGSFIFTGSACGCRRTTFWYTSQ